jgi:hypothetical protein
MPLYIHQRKNKVKIKLGWLFLTLNFRVELYVLGKEGLL